MQNNTFSTTFADYKPHYELLDGLRGVAALLVVWYHIFEGYSFAGNKPVEGINHGYLAVDFFFILSGFVIAYAYDDRWGKSLTKKDFFKRRLIRLHPMVIMGAIFGVITFIVQGGVQWDGTHIANSAVMIALLLAMFLIPAYPGASYEVRGNGEMFPLNGPSWSLFFEYIGNILYALFIRRLSNIALTLLVAISGIALACFTIFDVSGYGYIGVGWTLDGVNFLGGFLRMIFPFSMGMLLWRNFKPVKIRGIFWISTAVLFALFFVPEIEGKSPISFNGLFEAICIIFIFPTIVWLAASGRTTDRKSTAICIFLGATSYPLYMVHCPFMYLFYGMLINTKLYTFAETWQVALTIYIWNIVLAYITLKYYDEPFRKWLSSKFLKKKGLKT